MPANPRLFVGLSLLALAATTASARPGPDVTLLNIPDVSAPSAVGDIRGYAIGSNTCNIGNQNLLWLGNGTPGLAMNAYRLKDGRLVQIGMGWVKTACCAAAGSGCGLACNNQGGQVLGIGCLDTYGSGWNGIQSRLGARSSINPFSGAFSGVTAFSGDAISRRLQIKTGDLDPVGNPGALYFLEGQYIGSDDASSDNDLNNASFRRATVNAAFQFTLAGATTQHLPAITAWRANGLGAGVVDTRVTDGVLNVPSEGRFHTAVKVTDNGNGTWTYDYAIYNLSSDRAGGSLSIPAPEGVTITAIGFNGVPYHSGEPYSNTAWTTSRDTAEVRWSSPQTFAQNANTNALRWGTMYNFWFTANRPPVARSASLGLFKPHTPAAVGFNVSGPDRCRGDFNGINGKSVQDIYDFLGMYFIGDESANVNGANGLTVQDLFDHIALYFGPC